MSGALIGGQDCACELNSGERMLAGGGGMVRRPNSGEALVHRRKTSAPARKLLPGKQTCARLLNSGERMFSGGCCIAVDRTPAKPLWSEVIVFWEALLRRKDRCPEEIASSDERGAHRRTDCARNTNAG